MILLPAIDIRGGHAVRLLQGDYGRETTYDDDPADAAARWVEGGAEALHVVDLDGARDGRPANLDAVSRVAAAGVPVQLGGGLRGLDDVAAALDAGAEKVVVGTAALRDPPFLASALDRYGECVVVSVDARGGRVALSGWAETGELEPGAAIADLWRRGVERFVFTPIEVDGTMEGPNLDALRSVAGATAAELTYSGGVGDLSDLRSLACLAPANVSGVIVGRALYEGRFTVAEAKAALAGA